MPENKEIYKTLDLCLRIGEVLLSSGAGAADVVATMLSLAHGLGLRNADVDLTFTALTMSYQVSPDEPALIQVRNVRQREIDYEDLTRVDHLIHAVLRSEMDRDEARQELARITSSGHRLPRWAVTVGLGMTGLGWPCSSAATCGCWSSRSSPPPASTCCKEPCRGDACQASTSRWREGCSPP